MSVIHLTSIVLLVVALVTSSIWKINLGVLLLSGAFVVAFFGGLPVTTVAENFPGTVFVMLAAITYLFAIVESSGAMHWLVQKMMSLLGGRIFLVPFVFFVIPAAATSVGTYPTAVVALVVPVAMRFAKDYGISRFLMAVMVIHGTLAGSFGPLSPNAILADQIIIDAGQPSQLVPLFLSHLAFNGLVAAVVFLLFGGLRMPRSTQVIGSVPAAVAGTIGAGSVAASGGGDVSGTTGPRSSARGEAAAGIAPGRPTAYQVSALVSLALLVVGNLALGLDVAFVALALGVVLTLAFERKANTFIEKMPWSVMMLVAGVMIYIAVLTELGTMDTVGDLLTGTGSPVVGLLSLSFLGAALSAFASSLAVLGANLQLGLPMVGDGGLTTLGVVGPITVSAFLVDASPMSLAGALAVGSVEREERATLTRKLLAWGLSMVVIGPLLSLAVFSVI